MTARARMHVAEKHAREGGKVNVAGDLRFRAFPGEATEKQRERRAIFDGAPENAIRFVSLLRSQ